MSVSDLMRVTGMTLKKARELVDEGITSVEELHGIKDRLNKGQRIGLKHFDDFEMRIPRAEIKIIEKDVKDVIRGAIH